MPQDEALRPQATAIAQRLRAAGRRVDLVLEPKRLKWAFKQAERCGAGAAGAGVGHGAQGCAGTGREGTVRGRRVMRCPGGLGCGAARKA